MGLKQLVKDSVRKLFIALHLDVTKNIEYDRLTLQIFKTVLKPHSNAIDIGCHKGEMLDKYLTYAPGGLHYAFEPLPDFFNALEQKYRTKNVVLHNVALSDVAGENIFTYVKNNPAYSGFKERDYDNKKVEIEKIKVKMQPLDDIIPDNLKIDLIKIDVEGAELQVLKGAVKTIQRSHPVVVFEHGLGASEYYQTTPKDIYQLLHNQCGLNLYTLKNFCRSRKALTYEEFDRLFQNRKEYYFVASI